MDYNKISFFYNIIKKILQKSRYKINNSNISQSQMINYIKKYYEKVDKISNNNTTDTKLKTWLIQQNN